MFSSAPKVDRTDAVAINALNFGNKRSSIITKLKTSSRQKGEKIKYKMDTGSGSNILPFNLIK